MNKKNGTKRHATRARLPKTAADFLHWLQRKKTFEAQVADQAAQARRADSQALMVWADDGGRTA